MTPAEEEEEAVGAVITAALDFEWAYTRYEETGMSVNIHDWYPAAVDRRDRMKHLVEVVRKYRKVLD